jgi:hypothetical protein
VVGTADRICRPLARSPQYRKAKYGGVPANAARNTLAHHQPQRPRPARREQTMKTYLPDWEAIFLHHHLIAIYLATDNVLLATGVAIMARHRG